VRALPCTAGPTNQNTQSIADRSCLDEAIADPESKSDAFPDGCSKQGCSKQGHTKLAEADFRKAIALAQSMSAKEWELRTTMSLARLLASHCRRDEARAMLADIYNWFTEGFDTADLKDAKALLDQLNGGDRWLNETRRLSPNLVTEASRAANARDRN
jgi:hypothetical protein